MNKNTIYYRFSCENKKYNINFDTTEISIGDIKKEIIKRRNMNDKCPEKFELIFYKENNEQITSDNFKVEPLQKLIIKRFPSYRLSSQFIKEVTDPSQIPLTKGIEFNRIRRNQYQFVNASEPLGKIGLKLTLDILQDKFKCRICQRKEDNEYKYLPVITLCCYETICKNCYDKKDENECPFCKKEKNGIIPNNSEKEFKEKLYEVYEKMKENAKQIQKEMEQEKFSNNNNPNNINYTQNRINFSQLIPRENPNPSYSLFENAKFYIIKSSNKENLEISQKQNEWATTIGNQKKLNDAFQKGNVILIFSASRTSAFQGYAIMTSYIGDKVSAHWQNENGIKLGGSFSVYWLCTCELSFGRIKDLQNPLNQESVYKSRDSTELSKEIGIKLCSLCYEQEKVESGNKIKKEIDVEKIESIIKSNKEKQMQKNKISNINGVIGNNIQNSNNMNINTIIRTNFIPNYQTMMMNNMCGIYNMNMIPILQNQQFLQKKQFMEREIERERSRDKSRDRRNKSKSKSRSRKSKDD